MDLGFHSIAKHGVHHLMSRNRPLTFKFSADNDGLEMMAIAIDLEMFAAEALGNVALECFGGNHGPIVAAWAQPVGGACEETRSQGCLLNAEAAQMSAHQPARGPTLRARFARTWTLPLRGSVS